MITYSTKTKNKIKKYKWSHSCKWKGTSQWKQILLNAFRNEIFIIRDKNINNDDDYYAYDNQLDFEEMLMPESPTTASPALNLPKSIWTRGKGTKILPLKQMLQRLPILVKASKNLYKLCNKDSIKYLFIVSDKTHTQKKHNLPKLALVWVQHSRI